MSDLSEKVILNRYRIDEFLVRGGMADVYKVWDGQRAACSHLNTQYCAVLRSLLDEALRLILTRFQLQRL